MKIESYKKYVKNLEKSLPSRVIRYEKNLDEDISSAINKVYNLKENKSYYLKINKENLLNEIKDEKNFIKDYETIVAKYPDVNCIKGEFGTKTLYSDFNVVFGEECDKCFFTVLPIEFKIGKRKHDICFHGAYNEYYLKSDIVYDRDNIHKDIVYIRFNERALNFLRTNSLISQAKKCFYEFFKNLKESNVNCELKIKNCPPEFQMIVNFQ